jgi:hypothetical protein
MPLPSTKKELLNNLNQAYERLDGEFDVITKDNERLKEIEGNVCCCDVVAYQIGWAKLLLGWEQQEAKGKKPKMPAPGYKWNQLGELTQSFYERESSKSLTQLRQEFEILFQEIVSWVDSLKEQELLLPHQRNWTGNKWAIVKWVQVNTIAPYRSARTKVRRWKKENRIQ